MKLSLILPLFLVTVCARHRHDYRQYDDAEDAVDYSQLRSNLRRTARPDQHAVRQPEEPVPEWAEKKLRKAEVKNRDWRQDQRDELRQDVFREWRGEEPLERMSDYETFQRQKQQPRRRWNRDLGRFEVV